MPIPGNLITADIQGESYYQEYLAKVSKHQRYLAGETGSDPDSPTPKPIKTAKKSKPTAPKAYPRPLVSKPASSKQPEPKPAPSKTQGKKRKLVTDISDKPFSARKSKLDLVTKRRNPNSSLRLPPASKPALSKQPEPKPAPAKTSEKKNKLVTDISDKLSSARKSNSSLVTKRRKPTSSLRPIDKSVAEGIPKKEHRVDDEEADVQRALEESLKSIYDVPRHDESSSLYAELGLTNNEEESDEDVPRTDVGVQGEGQAGSNPDKKAEGQAGPNPDEGFTATAYPKVQENLKLMVQEHVILEEPASSSRTLSSLQHLTKDLGFGDLFFSDKPLEADNDKATVETEAESMVSVTIQQDTSSIPPMTTPIINLTLRLESPKVHQLLKATATETTTTTKIHPPPSQPQQSTTYSMLMKHIVELEHIMANMIQDNNTQKEKKRRDSPKMPHGSPPHQRPPPPPPTGPSGASGSPGAFGSSQVMPPPPPPSINQEAQSSDDEDIENAHNPKASPLASTYLPPPEDSLLMQTGDIAMFMDWFYLEYLRYDRKGSRPALLISKMKAAYYPDVGLEQMVPDQMWIEEECKYDIAAMYGISHYWFQRHRLYIDRHTSEGDRKAVRTHMQILSVFRIEVFSMYGDLPEADMKEILHQRMWETDSYKTHEDHMQLYEALEKSMNHDHSEEQAKDLVEACKKKKKSHDSPKTPPGSPPHQPTPSPSPAGPSGALGFPGASGSSQVPPLPPPPPSTNQE
nr:hypothetical protein [Tanacetum cinerariifolium]